MPDLAKPLRVLVSEGSSTSDREAIKQSVRRPVVRAHLEKIGQALDWQGALSIDYIMPDDGTRRC
jgi:hypothetical protein